MDYEILKTQEEIVQFEHFSNQDAIEVGLKILDIAERENVSISIDISRCGQTLFHIGMNGTTADNDDWMRRKRNTVYRFAKSSIWFAEGYALDNMNMSNKYGLSYSEFALAGGGFPVKIKGTGFVGAVIVSGLTGLKDHELARRGICEYLGIANCPQLSG